jgi:hypothetical protein
LNRWLYFLTNGKDTGDLEPKVRTVVQSNFWDLV